MPRWRRALRVHLGTRLSPLGTGTTRDREAAVAPPTQPVIGSHRLGFALEDLQQFPP